MTLFASSRPRRLGGRRWGVNMTVEAIKTIREQLRQRTSPLERKDDKFMEQLVEEANQRALKGQQHDK